MKVAIISGANGYLGKALTKKLLEKNVKVFAIVRTDSFDLVDPNLVTIKGNLNDMESILNKFKDHTETYGSVFYHTAWRGYKNLTDGDLKEQLVNVTNSVNALKIAGHISCSKFINVGSQEERFFEKHLDVLNEGSLGSDFSNLNYGTAKLASRDMCLIVSYLEKIDYIHTRLSVVTDPLSNKGYINGAISKIRAGQHYEKPKSSQLHDFSDIDDVTNAFIELGEKGQNKRDYYIGSGKPRPLHEYFEILEDYIKTDEPLSISLCDHGDASFEDFNNELLIQDTGIQLNDFKDYIINYKAQQ